MAVELRPDSGLARVLCMIVLAVMAVAALYAVALSIANFEVIRV